MSKLRYIEYNSSIYVSFGIIQDRFHNLYFHVVKLQVYQAFLANSKDISSLLSACPSEVVPINEAHEIVDPVVLETLDILYE